VGLCLAFVGFLAAPTANADNWDKKTLITFDRPIEVPGKVLPAGTYLFQVMDFLGERSVVRITNEEGTKIFATVITVWDYRYNTTEDTKLFFYEAPVDTPESLRTWFYPNKRYGYEFVYPRTRAGEIAKFSGEPVLAAPPTVTEPELEPAIEELIEEPIVAVQPTGEEYEVEVVHPPLVVEEEEPFEAVEEAVPVEAEEEAAVEEPFEEQAVPELPRTASPFALLGLAGLLSAAAAAGLRLFKN
jgi:hypothetical protein